VEISQQEEGVGVSSPLQHTSVLGRHLQAAASPPSCVASLASSVATPSLLQVSQVAGRFSCQHGISNSAGQFLSSAPRGGLESTSRAVTSMWMAAAAEQLSNVGVTAKDLS
jgi:hypothetical protein